MLKIVIFLFLTSFLFANICWCNMYWMRSGGSWCSCPKEGVYDKNHQCIWTKTGRNFTCVKQEGEWCPSYMKKNNLGKCIPNPELSKNECIKNGGEWVDASSFSSLSSLQSAVASLYGSGCYSPTWVQSRINEFKEKVSNLVTPKNVLLGALALLPVGRLFKSTVLLTGLLDAIKSKEVSPALLQDNRLLINTKYNPEKGIFEPDIKLVPRNEKLPVDRLFKSPKTSEEASEFIQVSEDMNEFANSKFADITPKNFEELTNEKIAFDIDKSPMATKIIDDLRDIFKRSKPNDSNFPVKVDVSNKNRIFPIKIWDSNGKIDAIAIRKIKNHSGNSYSIIYNIKPEGASKPLTIIYNITKLAKNIQITPKYKVGDNKYIQGNQFYHYNKNNITTTSTSNKSNTINNYYNTTNYYNTVNNYYNTDTKEKNETNPDLTSFKNPVEEALKNALGFSVSLFSCPVTQPTCPHSVNLTIPVLPKPILFEDPLCKVINTINNKNIKPTITWFGNILVMMAGVFGLLTMFKRN